MNDSPSQQLEKFIIRLPDGMRERIKAAADANNRSMNAEIVATLDERYPAPETLDAKVERMILAIGRRIPAAQPGSERTKAIEEFLSLLTASGYSDQQAAYWLDRVQKG